VNLDKNGPSGTVLNLGITTGQFCSVLGLLTERTPQCKIEISNDGKGTYLTTRQCNNFLGRHSEESVTHNLFLSNVGRKGKRFPFRVNLNMSGAYRYRKGSDNVFFSYLERRRYGFYLDNRCSMGVGHGSECMSTTDRFVSIQPGDRLTNIIPLIELAIPYKNIRSMLKKYGRVCFVFRNGGFSVYDMELNIIEVPPKVIKNTAIYHPSMVGDTPTRNCDGGVVIVTEEDLMNRCTRGLCDNKSKVLVGISANQGSFTGYLGFVSGKNWGRGIICQANNANGKITHHVFDKPTTKLQGWKPPSFAFNTTLEDEEMSENDKRIMRSWWSAYIMQQAKKGEKVSPEHNEVAEKHLG